MLGSTLPTVGHTHLKDKLSSGVAEGVESKLAGEEGR